MSVKVYRFGDKEFRLDLAKATEVLKAKKSLMGVLTATLTFCL